MKTLFVALGVFFCLSVASHGYSQTDRTGEVKSFMAGLNSGSSSQRVNTAKRITQSGITEPALYEKVATLLKDGYADAYEAKAVDEMAWLCKALAASGDAQYKELLAEIAEQAPSPKLQHYAKQSTGLIAEHADRNKTLNAWTIYDPEFNEEENRLVNMLKSEKLALKKDAAKMMVRSGTVHKNVYYFAASELETIIASGIQSNNIDTLGWLCKALGSSGNTEFVETLQRVFNKTDDVRLKNHASQALKDIN